MFRKNFSKIVFAVAGLFVFLTACKLEVTQEPNAEEPVFSIEGAVDYNDAVTITTATEGAEIFYTTDDSDPTAESTKYTGPVAITADCTIKAVAVKAGMQNSVTAEKTFTVKKYTVTFDANGHGTAPGAVSGKHKGEVIALPAALSATGYNFGSWSDGTNTYAAGATYTVTGNVTISAVWTEWNTASAPIFSVADSQIDYNDTVTITTATDGATIYYTTDGSTPTSSGTQYTTPIAITSATTIKAIAVKSGMNNSAVTEKAYTVKTYTVTFNANGHGTAPDAISGKYQGDTITLPAALSATGFTFGGWSDGTNTYAAGATYTVTGNVTISAVWTDTTPPANVTNLTATCTASGTVKLTWTNPTDADFAKVVITYGTSGSVTVLKTASPNNEKKITGLTNGTEYTFTVKAYDNSANASSGMSVNCTPGLLGGLFGTPTGGQTQGAVIKESWMDPDGNIKINNNTIAKTSEVVAIPAGTVAAVTMPVDQGVFLSGRKVKLDPFVMSQYQVTQKLYNEVMEENPSYFKNNPDDGETQENRPVEKITWYQACAFCNELTKKTFGETAHQCVYYSDVRCTEPYTISNAYSEAAVYAAYDISTRRWTKKGYRLPTEAEWEFCARGGDPNAVDGNNKSIWSYAYAGVQTSKQPTEFTSGSTDTPLNDYAWYKANGNGKTHEVGKKSPNTLGLYDMSGNVCEWCYDLFDTIGVNNDAAYTTDGNVVNPLGSSTGSLRVLRGGSYDGNSYHCAVSYRYSNSPSVILECNGFRLVRSISN